ncbi:MAG TPA: CheR family methyltransferase [Vicinamibacterales bacterium]|jgi:chemotaxis protein methyltransferase CheR
MAGTTRTRAGHPWTSTESSITDEEFQAFQELIYRVVGISLGPSKVQLVASRLAKRLRHLGMETYADYYHYLTTEDPGGDELTEMVNCITTNKTSFFREGHHFEFLGGPFLTDLVKASTLGRPRRLDVWSAGCSTGEEPFSIAMTLRDALHGRLGWDAKVLATDVDTDVLQRADEARYSADAMADLPEDMRRRYFLRGVGSCAGSVQLRPEVREMVVVRQVNLADRAWQVRGPFDAIFCRNVLIYFDRPTQQRVVSRFAELLRPGGYLFLGHSENLFGICPAFETVGQTTYRLAGSRSSTPLHRAAHGPSVTVPLGGVSASREPVVLRTVLGSCVAACLFDPVAGVGGMNHFLLPGGEDAEPGSGASATTPPTGHGVGRYGVDAMRLLIAEIVRLGGDRRRLQAKAFGGTEAPWLGHSRTSVPRQNVEFVTSYLRREDIPLVAHQFGSDRPIEVRFSTAGGRAMVRPLGAREMSQVVSDEAGHCNPNSGGGTEPCSYDIAS